MGWKTNVLLVLGTNKRHLTRERLENTQEKSFSEKPNFFLTAEQNNAIKTNYVKEKIDKTQQKSLRRFCGERHEAINHIISKCNKLHKRI